MLHDRLLKIIQILTYCLLTVFWTSSASAESVYYIYGPTGALYNNGLEVDSNIRAFQVCGDGVYVLGKDNKLWRDHPDHDHRDFVNDHVVAFQAADDNIVYVLGDNGKLWRDDGSHKDRIEITGITSVKRIQQAGPEMIYILTKDDELLVSSHVNGAGMNASRVDANVKNFQIVKDGDVYVLGKDDILNRRKADSSHEYVDGNVQDFKAWGDIVFVLGKDGRLWRDDHDRFHHKFVDENFVAFEVVDEGIVYVLGKDHKLWREHDTLNNRDLVDDNVERFEASTDNDVYVVRLDGRLWHDHDSQSQSTAVGDKVHEFAWSHWVKWFTVFTF